MYDTEALHAMQPFGITGNNIARAIQLHAPRTARDIIRPVDPSRAWHHDPRRGQVYVDHQDDTILAVTCLGAHGGFASP